MASFGELASRPSRRRLVRSRFRFFFFSNEGEEPAHIHVRAGSDEAKYWLEPIELAANYGFNGRELSKIEQLIEQHHHELLEAWNEYFS